VTAGTQQSLNVYSGLACVSHTMPIYTAALYFSQYVNCYVVCHGAWLVSWAAPP